MIIPSRLRALIGKRTEPLNTIYLNPRALIANYEYLQGLHPTDALFPVIKSNAYGHGIAEIATILNYIPATYLCVDSYPEYKIAAKHAKNHQFLVMSDTNPHNYNLYNWKKSVFVVSSFTTLNFFVKKGRDVRIHLFVNTGMNREGFDMIDMQELAQILRAAPHITVDGLMSHLSHSDDPDMTRTQKQVDRFKEFHTYLTNAGFSPRYRHIGASAGCMTISDPFFTAWRAGLSLYGYSALNPDHQYADSALALQPVARVTSTVLTTRTITPGHIVGYNGTRTAEKETTIGLLPFGYYEGLPRPLSNQWTVQGPDEQWIPLIGTISMNYSTISIDQTTVTSGDQIELFGDNVKAPNSPSQAAIILKTNIYEVLIRRNEKIRRVITR